MNGEEILYSDELIDSKIIQMLTEKYSILVNFNIFFTKFKIFNFIMYIEDVSPDSPAEKAGLIAKSDYIIGSPEAELNCLEDI